MPTSAINIFLALFVLTGSYLSLADPIYKKYISLISDVHEHYKTSSVFFIFSRNNRRMQEYTMVHLLARTFSAKGVVTLIINFAKLDDRLNAYRNRMNRPLIVVLLKSRADIAEFNEGLRAMSKSYPIWLVIFYGKSESQFCGYCARPPGNMFGLRFDTMMLVVCCHDRTIREWWSVHEDQTEMDDLGIWTANGSYQLMATDGLNARRHDVQGTGLRVVIVPSSSLIHDYGYRVGGFFGEVLRELKRAMNFTITSMLREEGYGGYNATSDSWSGAVGLLARGEADLAIADLTMTNPRLDVIDFTYPLLVSKTKLYIKEPDGSGVQWSAYFGAFTLEIWLTIIILVITTPLLLTLIKVKSGRTSMLSVCVDNYLCVWGIFCQQGLFEFPIETPLRIAYFSIFLLALVVSAAYSASLISFLTVSSPSLPFSTMLGFVDDGSFKLMVYQNSSQYDFMASSNNSMYERMMTLMKPWQELPRNTKTGWAQVCDERVALYTTTVERITMEDITCNVVGINTGHVDSLSMALPAGSQYTDVVNYHIVRFKANGIINRLKSVYYTKVIPSGTTHDVVEFSGVAPILSILAGGAILALVVLLCEKIHFSLGGQGRCPAGPMGAVKPRRIKMHRWFNFHSERGMTPKYLRPAAKLRLANENFYRGYYT